MSKNIFPLHVLGQAKDTSVMVELKSGDTYNGILKGVDKFMNIKMENSILSDKNAINFHSVKEVFIRGNTIKYFNFNDDLIDKIEQTEYVAPQTWKKSDAKQNKARKQRQN